CFEADQPQRTRWTQSETSWPYLGVLRVLCGDSAPLPRTESRTDGLESAWSLRRRRRRTERAAERRARTLMRRVRAVAPAADRRPGVRPVLALDPAPYAAALRSLRRSARHLAR